MRNKQQILLFLTNLIMFFTGMGLFPLLPPFAARFGASQTMMGIFLASLSAMNAAGAILASRLLSRFAPKTLFIIFGAIGVPAMFLLPYADTLSLVMAAAGLVWFSGGFISALLTVLTGMTVEPAQRGRAFALLFLASPIAAILGGTTLGAVVTHFGYNPAFYLLTVLWALIPTIGLLLDVKQQAEETANTAGASRPAALGRAFTLLLVSALTVTAAMQMGNVAALLTMQASRFSASAISSTTVVAGLVAIPVVLFAGSLSDRIGRQTVLLVAYLLVVLTVFPLALATDLWHFSSGIALLLVAATVVRPGVAALATDLLPAAVLQRGLPLLDAGVMGVGIVGSAGAGYILEAYGTVAVSLLAATLAVAGGAALVLLCAQCASGQRRIRPTIHLLSRT